MKLPGLIALGIAAISSLSAQQQVLPDIPEVRGPFTLSAVYDSAAGHNALAYAGKTVPPVIRVSPAGPSTCAKLQLRVRSALRETPQSQACLRQT